MNADLFEKIEEKLSELLTLVNEECYNNFIQNEPVLKIYDMVVSLDNYDNILTDSILNKILILVTAKVDMYK